MQGPCPNCGNRITIDDSRVPDKPFSVRCPNCKTAVKFPGRAAAPPPAAPEPASADTARAESTPSEAMGEQNLAHLRRELAESGRAKGQVLVAIPERSLAGALSLPFSHLGYSVEALDNPDDATRRVEQALYDVVITTRAAGASARGETLVQRISRLSPDARRGIFLVLVGDEFRTGDGTQAFAALADLVVHPRDAKAVEPVLLNTLAERMRLYQTFLDTKKRHEAAAAP